MKTSAGEFFLKAMGQTNRSCALMFHLLFEGHPWSKCLALLALCAVMVLSACKVSSPGKIEAYAARKSKKATIGGKDWKNPVPDTTEAVKLGAQHFQHHCQICHGLDGHATGVPFAEKLSPPVPDLGNEDTQEYTDGQLKWIIENGIRFTGMPAWKGILKDEEIWHMVKFMRHLPPKGSLGIPAVFKDAQERQGVKGQSD